MKTWKVLELEKLAKGIFLRFPPMKIYKGNLIPNLNQISVLNPKASSDPYWRKMQKPGGGGESAPTGCFKCGRPGHWSRDCTLSPATTNPDLRGNDPTSFSLKFGKNDGKNLLVGAKESAVPKRGKQPRPKLTPEILMSDDGLGYVLRHFPRTFNYHGRGHEVRERIFVLIVFVDFDCVLMISRCFFLPVTGEWSWQLDRFVCSVALTSDSLLFVWAVHRQSWTTWNH